MEGVIKYRCQWDKKPIDHIIKSDDLALLNFWRSRLIARGVIGVDTNDLGFGNISIRADNSNLFFITGSQTGHLPQLAIKDMALVTDYSIPENFVSCSGLSKASSETLTHAVFYQHAVEYNAVIHIHSEFIWNKYRGIYPTTAPEAQYGTVELAKSLEKILQNERLIDNKVIILGGHPQGVVIFGYGLDDVGKDTIKLIDKQIS